jgi:hypothetical protein
METTLNNIFYPDITNIILNYYHPNYKNNFKHVLRDIGEMINYGIYRTLDMSHILEKKWLIKLFYYPLVRKRKLTYRQFYNKVVLGKTIYWHRLCLLYIDHYDEASALKHIYRHCFWKRYINSQYIDI